MDDWQWLLWVGLALLLGAIEIASLDFVFAMIAASALATAGFAALGPGFPLQVIFFAVGTSLLLALVRPFLIRTVRPKIPMIRTGTDAGVGQRAEVLEPVDARRGRVKLRGEVWSARAEQAGAVLPAGADVEVVSIDGATAVVRALPTVGPGGSTYGSPPPTADGPSPPAGSTSPPTSPPTSPWSPS